MSLIPKQDNNSIVNPVKIVVLFGLCFQNTIFALITRYSKYILHEKYSAVEVALLSEIVKVTMSGVITVTDKTESDVPTTGVNKLWWLVSNARKIILLVLTYSAMNLLSYYSLARIDVSLYTVLIQLKSVSTAAMAVLILGRNISFTKWRALILLVIGCILVASPTFSSENISHEEATSSSSEIDNNIVENTETDAEESTDNYYSSIITAIITMANNMGPAMLGIGAALLMVLLSGASAVYFESVLKSEGEKITIWERNFQMGFYSLLLLLIIRIVEIANAVRNNTDAIAVFRGWSFVTVLVSLSMAGNGLMVAATLKYADAVMKTLASAGSIVLATILGVVLLNDYIDAAVVLGCLCTVLAIVNFTFE